MAELVAVGGAELVDAVDFHFLFIVFMLRKNKSCTSVSLMYRMRYISRREGVRRPVFVRPAPRGRLPPRYTDGGGFGFAGLVRFEAAQGERPCVGAPRACGRDGKRLPRAP